MPYPIALPEPRIESPAHARQCVDVERAFIAAGDMMDRVREFLEETCDDNGIARRELESLQLLYEALEQHGQMLRTFSEALGAWCEKEDVTV